VERSNAAPIECKPTRAVYFLRQRLNCSSAMERLTFGWDSAAGAPRQAHRACASPRGGVSTARNAISDAYE